MTQKKALFITYENPFTLNSGDSIYTVNILNAIFQLEVAVDMIYFDSNANQPLLTEKDKSRFNEVCSIPFKEVSTLSFLLSTKPGMIVNRERNSYIKVLSELLKNKSYDFVFVNHQKMVFTVPCLVQLKNSSKLIFCSHNAEYLLSKNNAKHSQSFLWRLIYTQDALKTRYYENKWLKMFDAISAISEYDKEYYTDKMNLQNVYLFRPVIKAVNENSSRLKDKKTKEIVIVGSFDWGPKKENLMQFLKAKNFKLLHKNGFNVTIVGRSSQILVDQINIKFEGVKMTGAVPDVAPYYNHAKISVIPERLGGGFKLKVVEAALMKTAIFAIEGAITKCDFDRDIHFKEFDTFEGLIDGVIRTDSNDKELEDLMSNAYTLAKNDYSLGAATKSMNTLLDSLSR